MDDPKDDPKGSYTAAEMPGGLDYELDRLREQALTLWPKEARTLTWYGLRDGMSILEPGAGPGFITEQLLTMLPNSTITVVERDPALVQKSTSYLQGKHDGRLQIVEASIMDTGLPDNTFDFAYARLLFQHLPDPVGAAKEILRVLKPGGKLVIADPDEKLHVWEPPEEPEVAASTERFLEAVAAQGGNRLIGRRLPRILRDAGFTNLDTEALVRHSDALGIDTVFPKIDQSFLDADVAKGIITEQEKEIMAKSIDDFYVSDPLVQLTVFMACGEKP